MSGGALPPLLDRLVRLLAEEAVDDYLRSATAPDAAPGPERPNPVPLRDMDRAA